MVAFVDDDVTVVGDKIMHYALVRRISLRSHLRMNCVLGNFYANIFGNWRLDEKITNANQQEITDFLIPLDRKRSVWGAQEQVLTAFCLISIAVRAQTQNVDAMDLSPEELKTVHVYTASMYLQSDREAPSSVTIVTADQIRKFGYRTLAEILNSVRGFYVSYDRNYNYVGVFGFSRPGDYNDRFLLLVDGHRMNDNVYGQALIGTEFPLDIDLIDRVEVVRGPSSSLYGASAFFSVINVITKQVDNRHLRRKNARGGVAAFRDNLR
jgi:outer membrane receptor protein involved in Fe transport